MKDHRSMEATLENPTHLFISYAIEDVMLAGWLSRKLAAQGYAIWFDQLKLLGGEPWPQTIDDAIKNRTFRMLALMSQYSIHKPNPSKERTLALKIARSRETPDFLITLKVDKAELDWLTTDISYIAFNRGWAEGWRALLKKLEAISAPKTLPQATHIAASSFPTGEDLVSAADETLYANVIRVKRFPNKLRVFRATNSLDSKEWGALKASWPYYRINNDALVALFAPPAAFAGQIVATQEQCLWTDTEMFRGVRARDIAANLITRVLGRRLMKAGCLEHPKRPGTYYLLSTFNETGRLTFQGFRPRKTWLRIRGRVTFRRSLGLRESNYYYFAFRLKLARGLDQSFYVQLTPTLVFADEHEKLILDKSVGSRRKQVTKMWYNAKWLLRLMAAEQLLGSLRGENENDMELESGLLALKSPRCVNEALLEESFDEGESDEEQEPVELSFHEDEGDASDD